MRIGKRLQVTGYRREGEAPAEPLVALVVVCVLLLTSVAAQATVVKVTLRDESEVAPARAVKLADVAGIEGPAELASRAGNLVLTTGPLPSERKTIESSYVRIRLNAAKLTGKVVLTGSDTACLVGKCNKLSAQSLADEAKGYVLGQLPHDSRAYDVSVQRSPRQIMAGPGAVEIRPRLMNTTVGPGINTVALDVLVDGAVAATTSATLLVKAVAQVLVTTTAVKQGEALTASNTTWQDRDVTRLTSVLASGEDKQEYVARRTLPAGSIVTANDVAVPLAVRKGDSVSLTVKCGGVRLHTNAEARQDGRLGETIRVRSSVSSEDVRARILEPGLVEMSR